jgi:hypothetical protein
VLAAEAAAAVVLARKVLFDLPHGAGAAAVENVRRGQPPVQIDGPARMHGEQLGNVIPIEGYEIGDLLALGLCKTQPLLRVDLETDVAGRRKRDRHAGAESGGCAIHAGRSWMERLRPVISRLDQLHGAVIVAVIAMRMV